MNRILIIDDDPVIITLLSNLLKKTGFDVVTGKNGEEGLKLIELKKPDLIITDFDMPGINGIDVVTAAKKNHPDIPVIMLTCYSDITVTIKAIQAGAYDYIEKPLQPKKLLETIRNGILLTSQKNKLTTKVKAPVKRIIEENLLSGKTPCVREIIKSIGRISMSRMNVLIVGEPGTGIHEVANLIHYSGVTVNAPFVAINCESLDVYKAEQLLFGSYSDDPKYFRRNRKGKLEEAGEGTVFLDKFNRLPLNVQARLIQVLEDRLACNSDNPDPVPFKARVIAASSDDLEAKMREESLLNELFYMLKVFYIELPPLRNRLEDIPELTNQILSRQNRKLNKKVVKIENGIYNVFKNYDWPGNFTELENTIIQALVLAKSDMLELAHVRRFINQEPVTEITTPLSLAEIETQHITRILKQVTWNKQKAAKILKISRPTLNAKIQKYGLKIP